jgi:hypothetical protein
MQHHEASHVVLVYYMGCGAGEIKGARTIYSPMFDFQSQLSSDCIRPRKLAGSRCLFGCRIDRRGALE